MRWWSWRTAFLIHFLLFMQHFNQDEIKRGSSRREKNCYWMGWIWSWCDRSCGKSDFEGLSLSYLLYDHKEIRYKISWCKISKCSQALAVRIWRDEQTSHLLSYIKIWKITMEGKSRSLPLDPWLDKKKVKTSFKHFKISCQN